MISRYRELEIEYIAVLDVLLSNRGGYMTNLIYFVCAGIESGEVAEQVHVDMCDMAMKSLREFSGYEDDIMVITDRPNDFPQTDFVIGLSDDWVESINDIGRLKFYAKQWVNVGMYDSMMYLDNDVLVMNDIQPILDMPDETIVISEEYPLNMLNSNIPFLTEKEKKESEGMLRINTGVFCIDSKIYLQVCYDILKYLNHCLDTYDYVGVEQKPVNAMVVKGDLPYEPIPHGWTEFPLASKAVGPQPVFSDETKVLHFAGNANYADKQFKAMEETWPLIEDRDYREMRKIYAP